MVVVEEEGGGYARRTQEEKRTKTFLLYSSPSHKQYVNCSLSLLVYWMETNLQV